MPLFDRLALILQCHIVDQRVYHISHYHDDGRAIRELLVQDHFHVQRSRTGLEGQRNSKFLRFSVVNESYGTCVGGG